MITTVTGKNLVSVPVKIARSLGIEAGTRLEWEATDNPTIMTVKIHPTRGAVARQLEGIAASYVDSRKDLIAELDEGRAMEDEERNKQLS